MSLFRPARIIKVRILVTKRNYGVLMDILNDTATVHIEPAREYDRSVVKGVEGGADYRELSEQLQNIRAIESGMVPKKTVKRAVFKDRRSLLVEARKLKIGKKLAELTKERDSDRALEKELLDRLSVLGKLSGFKEDMSILSNNSVSSFIIDTSSKKGRANNRKELEKYTIYDINSNTVASVRKDERNKFAAACKSMNVRIESIPQLSGKVSELQKKTEAELRDLKSKERLREKKVGSISDKYYNSVAAIREQLEIETEKLDAAAKFGSTESVILVEGWMEEKYISRIKKIFSRATNDEFVLEKLSTKDLAPTKLHNPTRFRMFESFVKFYSLPKSDEVDPTILFGVVFPLFFGFMVGDAGYGLFMFLLFFLVAHRVANPPKKSHIPRFIARFVHALLGNHGLLILSKTIMIGSVVAVGFGLAFGQFFGFKLPYTPLFSVETGIAPLLLLSGWVGVAMVEFGYVLGVVNKLSVGDRKGAVGKIGWALTAAGVVIIGLNTFARASVTNVSSLAGYLLVASGLVLIARGEGMTALMEIPSVVSHILSYMRLIGILLASVILAEVIDSVFLADTRASFLFALVGGVILILGQLFNIVIAIFEAGIQGARLIYVEFFSKFLTGNGRAFKPFGIERKRTGYKFKLGE